MCVRNHLNSKKGKREEKKPTAREEMDDDDTVIVVDDISSLPTPPSLLNKKQGKPVAKYTPLDLTLAAESTAVSIIPSEDGKSMVLEGGGQVILMPRATKKRKYPVVKPVLAKNHAEINNRIRRAFMCDPVQGCLRPRCLQAYRSYCQCQPLSCQPQQQQPPQQEPSALPPRKKKAPLNKSKRLFNNLRRSVNQLPMEDSVRIGSVEFDVSGSREFLTLTTSIHRVVASFLKNVQEGYLKVDPQDDDGGVNTESVFSYGTTDDNVFRQHREQAMIEEEEEEEEEKEEDPQTEDSDDDEDEDGKRFSFFDLFSPPTTTTNDIPVSQ